MKVKTWFRGAALLTIIGLVLFLILINTLPLLTMSFGEGVSLYNLLIDVAAGVFTVWGLYWAASEFAEAQIRPDLRLIIGAESADLAGIDPLVNATDALIGRDGLIDDEPVSQVVIGLFLENDQPKAAQFVRVTLRVRDVPRPKKFVAIEGSFKYKPNPNTVRGEAVFLQFGEDLVVYRGDGAQLGNICIAWPKGTRPEKITLVAGLYSLPGEPKEVIVTRRIHWPEAPTPQHKLESRKVEKIRMSADSANQHSSGMALQRFSGKGYLRCQHGTTWVCTFSVIRLLNGRLQVSAVPEIEYSSSEKWNAWLSKCEPFVIEGVDDVGNRISAADIHFTRTQSGWRETLIGYARSAARYPQEKSYSGEVTIKCELTGVRLSSLVFPAIIRIEDFPVEIGRLGWQNQGEIDEHSTAY